MTKPIDQLLIYPVQVADPFHLFLDFEGEASMALFFSDDLHAKALLFLSLEDLPILDHGVYLP